MPDLINQTLLNRYRVTESLGRGGMAEVYKVWDTERNATLAMKVLHEDLALDNAFLRRFKREARTLSALQHPNIVRFYELEQDGRLAFILMDYVDGESLKHKIFDAHGPMPFDQVMQVMRPLCQALQFAHNKAFVHSDVKPGNIMMDKTGRVMLMDFGIARMTESATMTMLGAGTPAYMSPEQARGKPPTSQTDIYALGIILYEMLTGERPFTGELAKTGSSTSEKIRWEQLNTNPLSPRRFNREIGNELEAVVMRCLEKDPRFRFSSALELLDALEKAMPAVVFNKPIAPPALVRDEPVRSAVEKRFAPHKVQTSPLVWMIGGVVVIVLGVYLVGKYLSPPATPSPAVTDVLSTSIPLPVNTSTPNVTFTPSATDTPAASPTSIPEIGSTMISEKDGMTLLYVPAGDFTMGSTIQDGEKPVHTVYLDAFWIDQTEVTNTMFGRFIQDTGYKTDAEKKGCSDVIQVVWKCINGAEWSHPIGPDSNISDRGDFPVVQASWNDAKAYCEWAGRRLPTEAEWEKAARGTDGREFPWGNGAVKCGDVNFGGSYGGKLTGVDPCVGTTSKAGGYKKDKSPYGAYDMAGNVPEWTSSLYGAYPYDAGDGRENPTASGYRVIRGGSWTSFLSGLRSAGRYGGMANEGSHNLGFRCARGTSP